MKGTATMSDTDSKIILGRPDGAPLGLGRAARVDAFHRACAGMNTNLNLRMDATGVIHLSRQLEDLDATLYETKFPSAMAAKVIPVSSSIDPGAETHTYQYGDLAGAPRLLAAVSANDLPEATVTGGSETVSLYSFGMSYSYTVQELRRGAMAGGPSIDSRKASGARKIMALHFESHLAAGNSTLGVKGFSNNASVSLVSPVTGTWSGATALQMIADLGKLLRQIKVDSKGAHACNLVVLPVSLMALLRQTIIASTGITALEHIKNNYPEVRFEEWTLLETAGAGSVARIVAAEIDPANYEALVPVEFESFAPQLHGMRFVVPLHQRLGPVLVRYPLALRYMDGC